MSTYLLVSPLLQMLPLVCLLDNFLANLTLGCGSETLNSVSADLISGNQLLAVWTLNILFTLLFLARRRLGSHACYKLLLSAEHGGALSIHV